MKANRNNKRGWTHLTTNASTRMVDITAKSVTIRRAVAEGSVRLPAAVSKAIRQNSVAKGNVLETARIGAIQAVKRTSEWIPLCHPIPVTSISVDFLLTGNRLRIQTEVIAEARTGVEMEALTGTCAAALIVYDMCKGIDKGMEIGPVLLLEKEGGKSGHYRRRKTR